MKDRHKGRFMIGNKNVGGLEGLLLSENDSTG